MNIYSLPSSLISFHSYFPAALSYHPAGSSLSLNHVYALYTCADVLVTTPLRDGMNTLPFE